LGYFFIIPNLIVSTIVVTALTVASLICFFLAENVDRDDIGNMVYFIGLITLPCSFVGYFIVLTFVPYRGNNAMKIRQLKLKKLERKVRINKLKFWK
jgi:hypothetical protein